MVFLFQKKPKQNVIQKCVHMTRMSLSVSSESKPGQNSRTENVVKSKI